MLKTSAEELHIVLQKKENKANHIVNTPSVHKRMPFSLFRNSNDLLYKKVLISMTAHSGGMCFF
jgi:hypothetical protein